MMNSDIIELSGKQTFKIILEETDYLSYQLFTASSSARIRKKRKRTHLLLVFSFLIFTLLFYASDNTVLTYYFLLFTLVTLLFYPLYERSQYKKHYQKHLREHYKNRFGVESRITFNKGYLISSSDNGESSIKLSAFEEVTETAGHIYVKAKSGESLIVPKALHNIEEFKAELAQNLAGQNISWQKQLDWKWK